MKRAKKAAMLTLICSLLTVSLIPTGFVSAEETSKAKSGDDWLHTKGNKILDKDGNEVWLTGTNWFGFNTGTNCFDGIWSVNMKKAITGMADRGINLLRIPMSVEIIKNWSDGTYPKPNVNDFTNPELKGFNSLQVFDSALQDCQESGIKVMIDIHSAATDAFGHNYPVWYKGSITTDMFYGALEWMADRYKNNDTIVAFDLKNEPHGNPTQASVEYAKWDNSKDPTNWKAVAEAAGKKVLAINPNLLIMVEGVEAYPKAGKTYSDHGLGDYYMNWWGGNLRGVKDYPIDLGANQLVYSPHDYGPLVFKQPWFDKTFTEKTLYDDCWGENWAYINEKGIAPLLIGEWGGFLDGGDNEKWMTLLRDYMIKNHINHTFWCYNANSGDTGGLVNYDFETWDEAKYALLKPALWHNDSGKFIGLDHEVPLGKNGITVSEYYGNNNKVKLGDLDNDQAVGLIDIMMLKKYILKKISSIPAPDPLKAADFNNDGQINSIDYLLFKKQFTSGT